MKKPFQFTFKSKKFVLLTIGLLIFLSVFAQTLPTATQVASQMKVGWNLGNTLEAICGENAWGNPTTTQTLINSVKAAGFNTVRLPIAWDCHSSSNVIDAEWLARVKAVVDYCMNADMYVIINIHWDGGWLENNVTTSAQASVNAKQQAYWTQIANYFKGYDERVLFASANEPDVSDATGMSVLLSYHQTFINAVRATGGNNSSRTLIIQGPSTDIEKTNNLMNTMPTDQIADRLMVEVHYYTPYQFCLMTEDASWGNMFYYWGNGYHSTIEPSRNATWGEESDVERLFGYMKSKFVDKGIPVIIGEFLATKRSNPADMSLHLASRNYFHKYIVNSATSKGLIPFYWDTGSSDCAIFNRNTGAVVDQATLDAIMEGVDNSGGCTPTTITPYVQVDGGAWQQTSSVTVNSGAIVKLGPQPVSGGSWSWTGCGTSGTSREQTFTANNSCTATATYTNSSGCQSTQNFNITVSGGSSDNIIVRARGTQGSEQIQLRADGNTLATWTLGTSYQDYSASGSGTITLHFINDDGARDVQCDYTIIDGATYQSEDQATNTGVWQNDQCGGSYSEWLHCNGYIQYGSSGGNTSISIQENTTGFCSVDGTIDNNNSGYTGAGFANTTNTNGTGITWSVSVSGGSYSLVWRFANGASARSAQIMIDDNFVSNINFDGTGSWTTWNNSSSVNVTLSSGSRKIRLQATNSSGLPNIDYIQITGAEITPVSCPGLKRALTADQPSEDRILKIYPNPVTDNQLNVNLANFHGATFLRIFDLSGNMLFDKQIIDKKQVIIDISLNSGMYILQVVNNRETLTKKFIKE